MKSSERVLAPIVIFAYNRPAHIAKMLHKLQQCELAEHSELLCFVDGAKSAQDKIKVDEVVEIVQRASGFRSVTVEARATNMGLAANIIDGLNWATEQYSKVIVLEDDIVVAPTFLVYMNDALERYAQDKRVWHISAASFPVTHAFEQQTFFWRVAMGWGWATWRDRWQHFRKDPAELIASWHQPQIEEFNLYGSYEFWQQVELNHCGQINTWAVFWYATIFQHQGLCLSPVKPLSYNIGFDDSGTHRHGNYQFNPQDTDSKQALAFPAEVKEDVVLVSDIIQTNKAVARAKSRQKDKNINDLKALLIKMSRLEYSKQQYAGKHIGVFGSAEIAQAIHDLLCQADTISVSYILSDEHISAYQGPCKPLALSAVIDSPIELMIVCIEGEHEQAMIDKISQQVAGCQVLSWRAI